MIDPEPPERFLEPEHGFPRDALLVRPSLWAALSGALQILVPLLTFLLPLAMLYIFVGPEAVDDQPAPRSSLARAAEVAQLTFEFGFAAIAALVPAVRILFTRYAFGPQDLRVRRQVLERHEQRVEWQKITSLRYRRTLFDRLFGLERLEVVAYGRRGTTLNLVGLRNGSGFHQLVARRMRETATVAALFEND